MIIIREIEDAQAIESYILACWRNKETHDEILTSNKLSSFSAKLFKITFFDTQPNLSDEALKKFSAPEDEDSLEDILAEYESWFVTSNVNEEEAVGILLELGIDFRSLEGHPLHMTRYLQRQAEAAARGIMGSLPLVEQIQSERWSANLSAARETFEKNKRQLAK